MTRAFQDHQLRRYLLGDLPSPELGELETAYFGDPDLLARIELAKEDLADDYAAARLSAADREKFERRLLASDEGREDLAVARALRRAAAGTADLPQRSMWQIDRRWLSLAAVLTIAVGALLVWRLMSAPESVQESTVAAPASPSPPISAESPAPTREPSPAGAPTVMVATLILTGDLDRSRGQPPTLLTSSGATHVDLVVPRDGLAPGAARARATTVEGTPIWSGAMSVPDTSALDRRPRARLPVSALPPGDYLLSIDAPAADATGGPRYYFRVRER